MNDWAPRNLLEWARQVQAIAQNGLAFTHDPFDRERYTQLAELVTVLVARELELPLGEARALWDGERGYATPKVDVRGGVFREDQVLLVRERADGRWTLLVARSRTSSTWSSRNTPPRTSTFGVA